MPRLRLPFVSASCAAWLTAAWLTAAWLTAAWLTAVWLTGCAAPAPPARAPDFDGVVVGRTPRLDAPPTAPRLLLQERALTHQSGLEAPVPGRVTVEVGSDARTLEALPGGGYRAAEASDAWVGRAVRVWYGPGAARGEGRTAGDSALPRAAVIVADARP